MIYDVTNLGLKVFVCSPLRAETPEAIQANIVYAGRCCRAIMKQYGFRAFAPHRYYTSFLDEMVEEERELGIQAGFEDLFESHQLFYFGAVISSGMDREIKKAHAWGKPVFHAELTHDEGIRILGMLMADGTYVKNEAFAGQEEAA